MEYFIQEQVAKGRTRKRIIIKPHTFHDWYYVFFYHFFFLLIYFRVVCRVYAKREIAPKDAKKNMPTVQYTTIVVCEWATLMDCHLRFPFKNFIFFIYLHSPSFLKWIRLSSGKPYKRGYARDSKWTWYEKWASSTTRIWKLYREKCQVSKRCYKSMSSVYIKILSR